MKSRGKKLSKEVDLMKIVLKAKKEGQRKINNHMRLPIKNNISKLHVCNLIVGRCVNMSFHLLS